MAVLCLSYPFWRVPALFGVLCLLIYSFDALDGAVARMSCTTTKTGSYMDAIFDRYQEVMVFAAFGFTHDLFLSCYAAATSSLIVSYSKARVSVEKSINNSGWPDLMERMERVLLFCLGLMLTAFIPSEFDWSELYLNSLIWILALLNFFTAIQRFSRAKKFLNK
jgi:phosphatidylglycerophosphate synthase